MQRMMRTGLAALLLASIAGCGSYDPELVDDIEVVRYEYNAVRAMEPQGPKFNQGLRQGYLDYGDEQYEEPDFGDFIHFAYKAVDSAKGETVLPDEIAERTIPAGFVDELTLARARLMGAFDQGGRKTAPWKAALIAGSKEPRKGQHGLSSRNARLASAKSLLPSKTASQAKSAAPIWCSSPGTRPI